MKGKRFYRWAAVLAASLMLCVSGAPVFAAQVGTVRMDNVNVRSEASTNSDRVCKLPVNTQVDVTGQTQGSDGSLWYSISFTYEGSGKTGYIRSDMLTVSETPDAPEETEQPRSDGYAIQEPAEPYPETGALTQTFIQAGEESFTAWQVDLELTGGTELYLVYASRPDGGAGWYFYDPQEGTFQRDLGQFSKGESEPEGLIAALQGELTNLKESSAKALSLRLYVIVGLGALSLIFLILMIVFIIKYKNAAYEYYEEDEDDADAAAEEESVEEAGEKRRLFSGRKGKEEDEPDDFDDFLAAAKRKQAEPEQEESKNAGAEEEEDFSLTGILPQIDMSAILAAEEAARKESQEKFHQEDFQEPLLSEEDIAELEDFDIEILDLEDWDLDGTKEE